MAVPIVFISRNRIVEGRRTEFELAFAGAVGLIDKTKPNTALFAAYLDESGAEVHVVHVFPDARAIALHFEGSSERTQSASELITPAGFEIYGQAPASAIDQLRREADSIDASFQMFANPLGGFLRAR